MLCYILGFSRKINSFLVLILISGFLFISSLNAQEVLWEKVFDTGQQEHSMDVVTDSQGNIIVVGTVRGCLKSKNLNIFV